MIAYLGLRTHELIYDIAEILSDCEKAEYYEEVANHLSFLNFNS